MSEYNGPERRQLRCVLHEEMLKDMSEKMKDIHTLITGNGHPEEGILFRVAQNSLFRKRVDKIVATLCVLVVASLVPQVIGLAGHIMKLVADHG
jgi:hypothetical protein